MMFGYALRYLFTKTKRDKKKKEKEMKNAQDRIG